MSKSEAETPIRKMCGRACEVYSRVVGYYRPVTQWNKGKQEEFKDRLPFGTMQKKDIHNG